MVSENLSVSPSVCLSVCLSVMNFDLNYLRTGDVMNYMSHRLNYEAAALTTQPPRLNKFKKVYTSSILSSGGQTKVTTILLISGIIFLFCPERDLNLGPSEQFLLKYLD